MPWEWPQKRQKDQKKKKKYVERIIYHGQVGSVLGMQGCFDISKSTNVIHRINRVKKNKS